MSNNFVAVEEATQGIDDFLEHWGVRGMKWGRRKSTSSTSSKSSTTEHESADSKTAKSLKSKKVKSMSNDDLQKLTKRMQLEQQYKQLSAQQKASNESKGRKFAKEVLGGVGKQVATEYTKRIAMTLIEEQLKSRGSKFAKSASNTTKD